MKKNRYLNQLLDVIRILRGSEADLAKKHLKAYETNHTKKQQKMFQLYKYIKIKDIRDYDKLKKRVSPDSTDDSFNKLIRRTTDRIQESLIIDVNIRRKGAYSEIFRMKFYIRKQLIQGQVLMGRGLTDRPLIIFNKCIRYSKKYELYNELIDALYNKQYVISNTKGLQEFEKLNLEAKYYEDCRDLFNQSRRIYDYVNNVNFSKSGKRRVGKGTMKEIEKIRANYNKTDSANILSYYYLLLIEVANIKGDLFQLVEVTRKLIDLLKLSPAVYSKPRVSYLLSQLANYEFRMLNTKIAFEEVKEAIKIVDPQSIIYIMISVIKINILMQMKNYRVVIEEVDELEIHPTLLNHLYHQSVIRFQKACTYFCLGKFKDAIDLFSEKNEIEKDKEGWNVWIRIMRLLCSIELLKLNLIDYDVESFRKYLQRIDKQYEVRQRDKLVLKVLLELDKQNYDFEATAERRFVELEKLKSTDKKFAWNPDSPEMILFHDWFESKRLKKPYEPNFDVYREAWNTGE